MSTPVIYLAEAQEDVDVAYADYEQRRPGLGDRFLDQLRLRVEVISDNPLLYGVIRDEVRAAPLRKFPYVVYYRFESGTVHVLAVLHGHRHPRAWLQRI